MKDRIARSVFWIVWSRGAIQVVTLISTLLVARILDPNDYGIMALAGIWTGMVGMIADLGLGAAIIQFRNMEERELNACFWLTIILAGMCYLALYSASSSIAEWFASPTLADVLKVAGVSLLIVAFRVVPDSLLRKRVELDKIAQAEIASSLCAVPVVVGLAFAGAGVWALVTGALITPAVQTLVICWALRWWPGIEIGSNRLRQILSYSLAALGTKLSWTAYQQADSIVLGKVSGESVLGAYAIAMQVAMLPVEKVSPIINQLAVPLMADVQDTVEIMRTILLRAVRLVASITFPLCIGLMLVADDLVRTVLSEKWMTAVPAIQLLCGYAWLRSVAVLLPPVLMARYRMRFLFAYNVILLAVMPAAFWVGAKWAGAGGVATAWITVYPVVMVWMARTAFREVKVSLKELLVQLEGPLAATLLMAFAVLTARWMLPPWTSEFSWVRLGITSFVGLATLSASLWAFGGPVLMEIKQVVTWIARGDQAVASMNNGRALQLP